MTMIDPETAWFKISETPTYNLNEVIGSNYKYTDKSYSRVGKFFNNTWLIRYPCTCKFVFDNGSDFKRDFIPLLKDFEIKAILTTIKTSQANAPVEQVYQVILNMLVTKDIVKKVFDYIYIDGVKP